jgi:hypothetical protein
MVPWSGESGYLQAATGSNLLLECPQICVDPLLVQAYGQKKSLPSISLRNDLVDVTVPTYKLILAQENEILLSIHAPGLTSVWSFQEHYDRQNRDFHSEVRGSEIQLPIKYHADGSAYVTIIPMRLGKMDLSLDGRFPDGSIFGKRIMLDIDPPKREPQELIVGQPTFDGGKISLFLHRQPGRKWLAVSAIYDNLANEITIDPSYASFKVRTKHKTSPVSVDESTGQLIPLHVGHALIETSFGGKSSLTCVTVEELFDLNSPNYDHSYCEELLLPGERFAH